MQKKRCSKCGEIKEVSEFGKRAKSPDGLAYKCKECVKAYGRAWYRRNHKRQTQKMAEYRAENREQMRQYGRDRIAIFKNGKKCQRCPEAHHACLVFHHRDPSQKEHEVSDMISRSGGKFSDEEIWAEIAKCEVLCRNCHAKLHWETPGMWAEGPLCRVKRQSRLFEI